MATVNVRYMGDDVNVAIAFYTTRLGLHAPLQRVPGVRRCLPGGSAASAQRADELGRATDA